jgi:hypothetical protein
MSMGEGGGGGWEGCVFCFVFELVFRLIII